ncbi:MAG: lipid-A-disaccharide synthase [Acidaminococcales bacterium]|jgi:lipid-A-disaccharide synthase|nr:lipid-A-disaccharide synthase [Acidaminococcales bacterium]
MRQIMICAGEASGDLHAGALTRELLRLDSSLRVFGMGGEAMRRAGGEILFDIKDHGVMGFVEVIRKLPSLFKLRAALAQLMDERRPSCLVVIDYPDFNMRVAKIAYAKKIPVVFFISPSAWAWRKGRAKEVARIAAAVAAIFPFERDVYQEAGANVVFVGHPLLDIVKPSAPDGVEKLMDKKPGQKTVLLLPGSRLQEIKRLLPEMLAAAAVMYAQDHACVFYTIRAETIPEETLKNYFTPLTVPVRILTGNNYDIMSLADAAIAASGTVTLEAALCGLPSVIVYKTSPLTAFIVRRLIKIEHIGLPNIIARKNILPELLQEQATADNIAKAAFSLLDPQNRSALARDLAAMKERLGGPGALLKVAALVLDTADRFERGGFDGTLPASS